MSALARIDANGSVLLQLVDDATATLANARTA